MSRWLQTLLIALLGLAAGLFYGWRIAPVQYTNTTPNSLDPQYQNEYVLMVAESYQAQNDLDLAAHQLGLLGSAHPAEILAASLENADYSPKERGFVQFLMDEIDTWQPALGESTP